MCFVHLELDAWPFFSRDKLLILSWKMILFVIVYPWASRKWQVQSISPDLSYTPTGSVSVELFVLFFCFFNELVVALAPNVRNAPLCLLQSSWVWWDASTYHCMTERVSTERQSLRDLVPLRYLRMRLSLLQSSSLGALTRVVRKTTAVWISRCVQERKKSWAVVWWNAMACCSGSNWAS